MQSSKLGRVKKLEDLLQKIEARNSKNLLPIPERWQDFTELLKIRSGGEMKQFVAYEYQRKLIELLEKYSNVVILKSRQIGITQCISSVFLHEAIKNPASSSVLFMRNGEDASSISRRVKTMLSSIPGYALPENDSVGYLKIKGGGDLYFKNSGTEGCRSLDSVQNLLWDEAAFVQNISQIYSSSSPSSALSGDNVKKIIVSTPSSKQGFYWQKINENNGSIDVEAIAEQVADGTLCDSEDLPGFFHFVDNAGTCKVIIHFRCHPVYSQIDDYLGYRLKQDNTSEEVIQREYNLRFIDSSVAIFSADIVRKNAVGELEDKRDIRGEYFMGLDVSSVGDDFTVCTILRLDDGIYSLVGQYRKRRETSEYHIFQICELLKKFKPDVCSIEVTGGTGRLYLEQLQKLFPDLHFRSINTTADTKQAMVSCLQLALEKGELVYPEKSPLIDELLSFRREGRKLQASSGKHDDNIMAVCFALWNSPFNQSKVPLIDISKIRIVDEIDYSDVQVSDY